MLGDSTFFASFACTDLSKAKAFYVGSLGLDVTEDDMGMLVLQSSEGNRVLIYPKSSHVPAEHTVLNFVVPDIDAAVDALAAKGVTFEQYEGEIKTDEKGIHRGNPRVAWFRDPAGNILSVVMETA